MKVQLFAGFVILITVFLPPIAMIRKTTIVSLQFFLFWLTSFSQPSLWCLPGSECNDTVLHHTGFTLKYSSQHRTACWVAYYITPERQKKTVARSDHFRPDPGIAPGFSATQKDYAGSGYDRGHLAPAADMSWSAEAMSESFFFSNMSPQKPQFNRGIWKKLEDQVRKWAKQYDTLLVATGPILIKDMPRLPGSRVSIPPAFYKAVVAYNQEYKTGIAFIMPNEDSPRGLIEFAVPIDELERITGYDFFACLPDDEQEKIENHFDQDCWPL